MMYSFILVVAAFAAVKGQGFINTEDCIDQYVNIYFLHNIQLTRIKQKLKISTDIQLLCHGMHNCSASGQ